MTRRALGAAFGVAVAAGALAWFWARGSAGGPPTPADSVTAANRERTLEFWDRYRTAAGHRIAGRLEAAAEGYGRALELNPDHEDALYYLGNMRFDLGDFAGAAEAWYRLVGRNPAAARAHLQLGGLHLCLEPGSPFDLKAAETEFRRAHEINMEETGSVLHLGEVALMRGDAAAASRQFDAVLRSNPGSGPAHFYIGYLAWKAGRAAAARDAFTRAAGPAAPPAKAEAAGEGDTRSGVPLLSKRERCGELRELTHGLAGLPAATHEPEMTRRYRALDAILARGRERARRYRRVTSRVRYVARKRRYSAPAG